MGQPFIEMKGIVKKFNGIKALKSVDFEIQNGEIHGLLGENGAGKSTLIKILTGAYRPDEGEINVAGKSFSFIPVKQIEELGISVVYQDLKLAPDISILENIMMGSMPRKGGIFVDKKAALKLAKKALQDAEVDFNPFELVRNLKAADQEIVAIAKALSKNAKVLILDEPTALLAADDVARLFGILKKLVKKGVSIVYISHKLEEIFEICDRVTVLRDGSWIETRDIADVTKEHLIKAIAGKVITEGEAYYPAKVTDTLLKVENLSCKPYFDEVNFDIKAGEVVGLFGLVGVGKSEMLKGIFGGMKIDSGTVYLKGKSIKGKTPQKYINNGIGFVPEDRKTEGYLPRMSLYINTNLPSYRRKFAKSGWSRHSNERKRAKNILDPFNVKYSSLDQDIEGLSGGNQQKIVVAKWIGTDIDVLLLDEPTAGIDVGARNDIFRISRELADKGKGVLYCSSYLPEILEVADRILVMSDGKLTKEFSRADGFNDSEIMKAAYE